MADTLDFSKPVSAFGYYSQRVKDFMSAFRSQLEAVVGLLQKLNVNFIYASKSDQAANPNVLQRVENLKVAIQQNLTFASVEFRFWSAQKLLELARSQPVRTYSLEVEQMFPYGGSFICLVRLDRFADFITDENKELRQHMLEPNVRDYNGANNKVNGEIRATLHAGTSEEFWWLNNGITILAEGCTFGAGKLQITGPELVNGLQTSHEIFRYFTAYPVEDKRTIQVRVILPPNDPVRRRIIKATNNQTPVNPLSLHANDDIHFDIEEVLRLLNIFYDRRRGEHRRKKRPVSQIVSMTDLAQVVIATALRSPDQARARPKKRLDSDQGYGEVFDASASRTLYVSCVLVDKIVVSYLAGRDDISKDEKTDIRFYMDTWLMSEIAGKPSPSKNEIAALASALKEPVEQQMLDECCSEVRNLYQASGGDDKAAKGSHMRETLLAQIKLRFSTAAT